MYRIKCSSGRLIFADADDKTLSLSDVIKVKWNEVLEKPNVFRYKINNLCERQVGPYFLQLNPERNTKRRAPEHIMDICQPFDKSRFNFTKVAPAEVMFSLESESNGTATLLVNVSPISRYHTLVCPSLEQCLPQVVTEASLVLILRLMFLVEDRSFKIGFNSLRAFASVNHLHYHIFFEDSIFPIECAPCKRLKGPVSYLDIPAPPFCFLTENLSAIEKSAANIFKLTQYLLEKSIAHNIMATRGSDNEVRVVVWPRKCCGEEKQLKAFNVALCELSGWFPVYTVEEFENLQAKDLENELNKWKINNFESLCEEVKGLY